MENVMTRAWEIAKNAVVRFGGNAKEYFTESLKLAWKEVKLANMEVAKANHNRAYKVDAILPVLNGSEKQIKWANDIRDIFITNIKHTLDHKEHLNNLSTEKATFVAEKVNKIVRWAVENKTNASFWIYLETEICETTQMFATIAKEMKVAA